MLNKVIDAHIHLDSYDEYSRTKLLDELAASGVESLIAVSMNLESSLVNQKLSLQYPGIVRPAYGFHPEQEIPTESEMDKLMKWMEQHADQMVAVGEIGLPYYSRLEAAERGEAFDEAPYLHLLDRLLALAARLSKPVVLHAVYEDADIVCDLLEKHRITRAHFHWFKGAPHTIKRMASQGYYISFTPDLLYEPEIVELAQRYPKHLVMAETDGPWPFEGPFEGQTTHPKMVREVIAAYGAIHGITPQQAETMLYANTKRFYY
ncbi:putative deoxyribonuclease YcfH [compost metagenome]